MRGEVINVKRDFGKRTSGTIWRKKGMMKGELLSEQCSKYQGSCIRWIYRIIWRIENDYLNWEIHLNTRSCYLVELLKIMNSSLNL